MKQQLTATQVVPEANKVNQNVYYKSDHKAMVEMRITVTRYSCRIKVSQTKYE